MRLTDQGQLHRGLQEVASSCDLHLGQQPNEEWQHGDRRSVFPQQEADCELGRGQGQGDPQEDQQDKDRGTPGLEEGDGQAQDAAAEGGPDEEEGRD